MRGFAFHRNSPNNRDLPPELRDELEQQRKRDLANRQRPGILFYPATWVFISAAIMFSSPTPEKSLWLAYVALLIVAVSSYRYYAMHQFMRKLEIGREASYTPLLFGASFSAGLWGGIAALSVLPTPFSPHFPLFLTCTLGLCAGGAASLAILGRMVNLFIICLLAPMTLALFSPYATQPGAVGFLLMTFGLGMSWISTLPRHEYEVAVLSIIKLSQQAKYLTELTIQDGLTGVKNRRYFDQILNADLRRASRLNYPISLLLIDIDHFKRVNDRYGHLVGDECLVQTAQTLMRQLQRNSDVLARYGGEEFGIILPGVDAEEAAALAEKLRRAVAACAVWNLSDPVSVTISIGGVSGVPRETMTPKQLLELADKALYQAKSYGRNCVFWSSLDGVLTPIDSEKGAQY
ncbi:GGDEF domain-containing protein [Hahella aquimaris]|uniref:GGDEF domain-containing protein n=1 Tax=Hahella sp. HNIBRBA332 TaxID=3015983 RepID=UPI00273B9096|nr:GGDEF domain-containing protein [Hahella sp. HNIBRBA332]WLQ12649.1 GGDEF domain-containing protein [Hahella sp. HNIBRBA332]